MSKKILKTTLFSILVSMGTAQAAPNKIPSGDTPTPALFGEAKIIKSLSPEQRLARVEAYNAVSNVMGRYTYLHTAGRHTESESLFALNTQGVRVEMMWGVYEGANSIHRLYSGMHVKTEGVNDRKGQMHIHTLTTPVIEVAGDLKTARAVWVSPGVETGFFGTDEITANWGWAKYAADFIQENGEWKIWHLHVYGLFLSPYNKSWVEQVNDHDMPPLPDEFKPDRPPTTHWMYSPNKATVLSPAPPAPYMHFNDKDAY